MLEPPAAQPRPGLAKQTESTPAVKADDRQCRPPSTVSHSLPCPAVVSVIPPTTAQPTRSVAKATSRNPPLSFVIVQLRPPSVVRTSRSAVALRSPYPRYPSPHAWSRSTAESDEIERVPVHSGRQLFPPSVVPRITPLPAAQPVATSTKATDDSAGGIESKWTVASTVRTIVGVWPGDPPGDAFAVGVAVPVGVGVAGAVDGVS